MVRLVKNAVTRAHGSSRPAHGASDYYRISSGQSTGTGTTLSVLGADDGGADGLSYSWWTVPGYGTAFFSINDCHDAASTTVEFTGAGEYHFRVTVTGAHGLYVYSSYVAVTVQSTLTDLVLKPDVAGVEYGTERVFNAYGFDQFGNSYYGSPTWTLSGPGTLYSSPAYGYYDAPLSGSGGSATVTVSSGGLSASATVSLVPTPNPATVTRLLDLSVADGGRGAMNRETVLPGGAAKDLYVGEDVNGGAWIAVTPTFAPAWLSGGYEPSDQIHVSVYTVISQQDKRLFSDDTGTICTFGIWLPVEDGHRDFLVTAADENGHTATINVHVFGLESLTVKLHDDPVFVQMADRATATKTLYFGAETKEKAHIDVSAAYQLAGGDAKNIRWFAAQGGNVVKKGSFAGGNAFDLTLPGSGDFTMTVWADNGDGIYDPQAEESMSVYGRNVQPALRMLTTQFADTNIMRFETELEPGQPVPPGFVGPDGARRNPLYWDDPVTPSNPDGNYVVRRGVAPHTAIIDLWFHYDTDNKYPRTGCMKVVELIFLRADLELCHLIDGISGNEKLVKKFDKFVGHGTPPSDFVGEETDSPFYWKPLNKAKYTVDDLLPGDRVSIANPFHRAGGHGTEGSNVIYIGNNRFVGENSQVFESLEDWQKYVRYWATPNAPNTDLSMFPITAVCRPTIPRFINS